MGIIVDKDAIKVWYKLQYPNVNTARVGMTFGRMTYNFKLKKYGYYKVFTCKDKALKGKLFYIAIEGDEYIALVKKHFGVLDIIIPPGRTELTRVCGATIEHDWMFPVKLKESNYRWNELDNKNKDLVINAHAVGLKIGDHSSLIKIFDLGSPNIVIADDKSYCSMSEESAEAMKVLLKNYL